MAKKKPVYFRTIGELHALPADKIDHFCEDLRLWLHMHKQIAGIQESIASQIGDHGFQLAVTTPTEAFGWIDDGRHDARIKVDVRGLELGATEPVVATPSESPQSESAQDS